MKQFFYGVLFTLALSTTVSYGWLNLNRDTAGYKVSSFLYWQVFSGFYLLNPLQGNCVDEPGQNGHGWKFDSVADYYQCDRFQRLLNGNFKAPKSGGPTF